MPVGAIIGKDQINNTISALAVDLRNVMQEIHNLDLSVNGQDNGLTYLELLGFTTFPNPANPDNRSDAQLALDMISYLNTNAGLYFGTATQAEAFNFNEALSQVWGGKVEG